MAGSALLTQKTPALADTGTANLGPEPYEIENRIARMEFGAESYDSRFDLNNDGVIDEKDVEIARKRRETQDEAKKKQFTPEKREQLIKNVQRINKENRADKTNGHPLMAATGEGFGTIVKWTGISVAGLIILRQLTKKRSKNNG